MQNNFLRLVTLSLLISRILLIFDRSFNFAISIVNFRIGDLARSFQSGIVTSLLFCLGILTVVSYLQTVRLYNT